MSTSYRVVLALLILSAVGLPCDPARSQQQREEVPSFNERWNLPPLVPVPIPRPQPPEIQQPITPEAQRAPGQLQEQKGPDAAGVAPAKQPANTHRAPASFAGKASFYSYVRGKTASGAPNNPRRLTAAHRTLAFGTRLRVTDVKTLRTVEVVVNDRGPAIKDRVIDLSRGAAGVLGIMERGVAQVHVDVLAGGE